jgi:hypothetical protein
MKARLVLIFLVIISLKALPVMAQYKADNICFINNGRIYFNLDKRWTAEKRKQISGLFSLDSSLMTQAFQGKPKIFIDSISWETKRIDDNIVEISKQLSAGGSGFKTGDVFLIDDNFFIKPSLIPPIFAPAKKYGINEFLHTPSVNYTKGVARFYLAGKRNATQVYLSGTFNNWSTMEHRMHKTGDGWEISIPLAPGGFEYKFIVDGKWITDPDNLLKVSDGRAGYNSVFYCYNYKFSLAGYANAKSVIVSGSFNNWNTKKLKMQRSVKGWELPIYLPEGTYSYKFIVDREWINDPANKVVRLDASGNANSFIGIGDTLLFRLNGFINAKKVILAGSFNNWSTSELLMLKTDKGWELPYNLGAGNYEYKFIVDGRWITDPANPVTSGTGDFKNSCVSFKPNHTFSLSGFPVAKSVIVTGSFNNWDKGNYKMIKKGGIWTYPVFLAPGKYTYKFIIDGQWMIDPANELWEENETGTGNSVLWVEP